MASVNCFVKKDYKNKNGEYPILIEYSHLSDRIRIHTGERIDTECLEIIFSHEDDFFKVRSKKSIDKNTRERIKTINEGILEKQNRLKSIIEEQKIKSAPLTPSLIELLYDRNRFYKEEPSTSTPITFLDWYRLFISHKSKTIKVGGMNSLRSTLTHLKDHINKDIVLVRDLKRNFFERFVDSLEVKGLKGSTINKQFKNIRGCLNWIANNEDNNLTIPPAYKVYKVKAKYADPIGLTISEFNQLLNLDLEKHPMLKMSRDLFVFGTAMGGLRYSDLKELGTLIRKYGSKVGSITFFETKTGNEHHEILLNNLSKYIINKYDRFPYVPTNQRLNKNLKKIASMLEWDTIKQIPHFNSEGRLLKKEEVLLQDLFSTKFMRKTSATIDGELNVEPVVSMRRSGHKSLASYLRYRSTTKKNFEFVNDLWNKNINIPSH